MGGKGRVVAAAVLHVQHQRQVKHPRLQRRILLVRAQQAQDIAGGGQLFTGVMDVHAAAALIMVVGVVGIDRDQREDRHQHEALAQDVGQRQVVGAVVVGREGQDAAREHVHHVVGGRFHDNVADEIGRQRAPAGEQLAEPAVLLLVGEPPENQ